ncbi:uncharacterized protein LOC134213727 [Armigeres subalbatus]|uniref:uncharacterized protein LOC134213727 n=1 Tax=Armigeres subalbatus TaxID=124917 RepID=UPI002ED4C44E
MENFSGPASTFGNWKRTCSNGSNTDRNHFAAAAMENHVYISNLAAGPADRTVLKYVDASPSCNPSTTTPPCRGLRKQLSLDASITLPFRDREVGGGEGEHSIPVRMGTPMNMVTTENHFRG